MIAFYFVGFHLNLTENATKISVKTVSLWTLQNQFLSLLLVRPIPPAYLLKMATLLLCMRLVRFTVIFSIFLPINVSFQRNAFAQNKLHFGLFLPKNYLKKVRNYSTTNRHQGILRKKAVVS